MVCDGASSLGGPVADSGCAEDDKDVPESKEVRETGTGALPNSLRHTGTRTTPCRTISDCEAKRQLVDCICLSARKKCLSDSVSACTSNTPPSYSYDNITTSYNRILICSNYLQYSHNTE